MERTRENPKKHPSHKPGAQKKVLSLVLCLAVMLSVMVVGAGAAFSDQDKIENTEAVDACSALNIINGYEDGAFHPERNIKRAEVTKMICVALNGGEEPNTSTNAKPTFTDVRGTVYAWAEGYIESCVAQGIVDGVGGNRFSPAGNVTAAQLAKMLLVSLGYNATTEKFTGNAWETNVNVRASQKHLYDGLEKMDTSAAVTRDQAAQMVWNAMQAYEVEYKDGVVQDKVVGSTNDKITLLRDKYDAWVYVGTLTEVDSTNITITMNAADRDASDPKPDSDVTSKSFSKIGQDYSSLLGQKVKVLFKDGKSNDVIGVYATSDNTVYKTLMNAVELDGSKIKFNGTSYSVDNTKKIATTFVGIDGTETKDQAIGYFDSTANNNANKTSLNEVTFVDSDANNKIDTAIVLEKKAAEVTNVSSDKITFDGKSYKFADEKIDKDIEQDDWAVMSVDLYNDCKSIVKAGVLTTTVDSYKQKDSGAKIYHQYKLDGTWYNMSDEAYTDAGVSTGDAVKAYVSNGVIVKMKADDGKGGFPSNIAVVVGNGGTSSLDGDQARIRLFDGTVKKVTISDKSKTPDLGKAYKISGSDEAMKFEEVKVNTKYNGYLYVGTDKEADPDNDQIGIATGTAKVDDSAVVILYTANGRSKQITGKQFNALETSQIANNTTAAKAVFTKEKNGLNRVMMASVLVDNINIAGKSSDNYGYITADASQDKNGNVSYTVWTTDNKYVDVVEEGTYSATDRQKGTLIGYSTIDSNGTISDVDVVANLDTLKNNTAVQGGTTTFNDDGTVYYGGNESEATKMIAVDGVQLNVTADTKVLFVDSDESDDKVGIDYTYGTTTMKKAQKNTDGKTYAPNVFFQVDENGKKDDVDLKVLVLDTTGAFDGFKPENGNNGNDDQSGSTTTGNFTFNVSDVTFFTKTAARLQSNGEVQFQFEVPSTVAAGSFDYEVLVGGVRVASGNDVAITPANVTTTKTFGASITANDKVVIKLTDAKITKYTLSDKATADEINDVLNKAGADVTVKSVPSGTVTVPDGAKLTVDKTAKVAKDAVIKVSDGATLDMTDVAGVEAGAKVEIAKDAVSVTLPNKTVLTDEVTFDCTLTVVANANKGIDVTVPANGKVTVKDSVELKLGTNDVLKLESGAQLIGGSGSKVIIAKSKTIEGANNFYTGTETSNAVKEANGVQAKTYTWATNLTSAANVSGWFYDSDA